jgi:lysophospholipid acyltransferase (LPLAT)-like uncharacterized protein
LKKSQDNYVLLTPDGPRGPRHFLKPGGIVASQDQSAILLYKSKYIPKKLFFKKSWDRFEFPLPLSRITIEISEPYIISNELNNNEITELIRNIEGKMQ